MKSIKLNWIVKPDFLIVFNFPKNCLFILLSKFIKNNQKYVDKVLHDDLIRVSRFLMPIYKFFLLEMILTSRKYLRFRF